MVGTLIALCSVGPAGPADKLWLTKFVPLQLRKKRTTDIIAVTTERDLNMRSFGFFAFGI